MTSRNYLKILVEEIHSVVVATTDANGLPSTRVIDMMLYDDEGLYFLTAKGKVFYDQLMAKGYVSLSAMTFGSDTMQRKAISISGAVRNIGSQRRDEIFEKNTYMAKIYPSLKSQQALAVFCLYKGQGEFFDLSTQPISRGSFVIGQVDVHSHVYSINDNCTSCGECLKSCPSNCIDTGFPYFIRQENCLHCGNCYTSCNYSVVDKP